MTEKMYKLKQKEYPFYLKKSQQLYLQDLRALTKKW